MKLYENSPRQGDVMQQSPLTTPKTFDSFDPTTISQQCVVFTTRNITLYFFLLTFNVMLNFRKTS